MINRKVFILLMTAIAIQAVLPNGASLYAKDPEILLTEEQAIHQIFNGIAEIKSDSHTLQADQWQKLNELLKREYNSYLEKDLDSKFNFFIGFSVSGEVSHYALIDVVPGKWGPITYIIGITPEGKVKDLAVMNYLEKRGRPVKERRFLDQFVNKSSSDPLKLQKDIKAISGATISSRGMVNGIKKALALVDIFYIKKRTL
jgi:Na+-translocating ferredoxin:NAD+ oxidoreductase RnfG subunit